jgi:hypothetical protein
VDGAPTPFQAAAGSSALDALERERVEVDAAIALVLEGVAMRVRVANLARPEAAAAYAAATAGGAPIRVRLEGTVGGPRTLCVEAADA